MILKKYTIEEFILMGIDTIGRAYIGKDNRLHGINYINVKDLEMNEICYLYDKISRNKCSMITLIDNNNAYVIDVEKGNEERFFDEMYANLIKTGMTVKQIFEVMVL